MNPRTIDVLIAEHVFGIKLGVLCPLEIQKWSDSWLCECGFMGSSRYDKDKSHDRCALNYATEIDDAWLVVEKMVGNKLLFDVQAGNNGKDSFYQVQIDEFIPNEKTGGGYWELIVESTEGKTAPMAICLAALKALGVKYE